MTGSMRKVCAREIIDVGFEEVGGAEKAQCNPSKLKVKRASLRKMYGANITEHLGFYQLSQYADGNKSWLSHYSKYRKGKGRNKFWSAGLIQVLVM